MATTIAGAVLPADAADPIQNPLAVEGSIEAVADAVANVGITALFLAILVSAGSFGLLTAVLGLAYAGAVLVLGELFGGVAGNPPSWAVWLARPWPWPRCSSRPAAASSRRWTGA